MAGWCALGSRDLGAQIRVLERAVRVMDNRIAAMPPGHDVIPIIPDTPAMLVVVEELPGLLRVLGTSTKDTRNVPDPLSPDCSGKARRAHVHGVLIAQRADADIIGGYERGQASPTDQLPVDGPRCRCCTTPTRIRPLPPNTPPPGPALPC